MCCCCSSSSEPSSGKVVPANPKDYVAVMNRDSEGSGLAKTQEKVVAATSCCCWSSKTSSVRVASIASTSGYRVTPTASTSGYRVVLRSPQVERGGPAVLSTDAQVSAGALPPTQPAAAEDIHVSPLPVTPANASGASSPSTTAVGSPPGALTPSPQLSPSPLVRQVTAPWVPIPPRTPSPAPGSPKFHVGSPPGSRLKAPADP